MLKKPWIWPVCRSTLTTRSQPAAVRRSARSRAGDRLAALGLPVLSRVRVERADRGDALRRGPLRGVGHDQLLEDVVVDRRAVALDEEHVRAAHAFAEAAVELAVGEAREHDRAERHVEARRDLRRELVVAVPGEHHEALLLVELLGAHSRRPRCPRRRAAWRSSPVRLGPARPWRARPPGTSFVTTAPAPV